MLHSVAIDMRKYKAIQLTEHYLARGRRERRVAAQPWRGSAGRFTVADRRRGCPAPAGYGSKIRCLVRKARSARYTIVILHHTLHSHSTSKSNLNIIVGKGHAKKYVIM
jgi:hypothetical protein